MCFDEDAVQASVEEQAGGASGRVSGACVGEGFRCDHSSNLPFVHAHCPHGAVLFRPGGYAHGDAVDNVQRGDQGDDEEKTIYEEQEGRIGAGRTLAAVVMKGVLIGHRLTDLFHGFVPCVSVQLYHKQRIAGDVCQAGKSVAGSDERNGISG